MQFLLVVDIYLCTQLFIRKKKKKKTRKLHIN